MLLRASKGSGMHVSQLSESQRTKNHEDELKPIDRLASSDLADATRADADLDVEPWLFWCGKSARNSQCPRGCGAKFKRCHGR